MSDSKYIQYVYDREPAIRSMTLAALCLFDSHPIAAHIATPGFLAPFLNWVVWWARPDPVQIHISYIRYRANLFVSPEFR
jgi:hypothetical protein